MKSTNLIIARNSFFFITFIAFSIQLFLLKNSNEFFCLLLLVFSNLLTTFYCFNKNIFFKVPITLMIIFFSHFINIGGTLYLKTLEISSIVSNLNQPLSTISTLIIFNLIIIISHFFYQKNNFSNKLKNKLNFFITNLNLFKFDNKNFFYFIGFVAILSKYLIYDLNTPYYLQFTGELSIFKDILNGMNYIIYIPIILFFNKYLQNESIFKINNFYILIYLILLTLIAIARNNRSMLFDFFLLVILIFLFLYLLNKIQLNKKHFFLFFIISFLAIPFANNLDKISTNFLIERKNYFDRSPIENVGSFFETLFLKSNRSNILKNNKINIYDVFSEENYSSTLFNRISITKVHDNFFYIKKNITFRKLNALKDIQINKIISIIPGPIIRLFDRDFDKTKYISFSTASYLYGSYDTGSATLNTGSSLMTMSIIFGSWSYLILLFCFIPVFIFFDSFYDVKKNILSPYIIIFFYTTSMGIFNFLAASDVYLWISFILRTIPQTFLIIILLRLFFNFFDKSKIA